VGPDPVFTRPPEEVPLVGDASHARRALDWKPSVMLAKAV
jgi:GDP-D-mannose dehydratase